MRKLYFSPKKTPKKQTNKNNRIFSLAWNILYWLLKNSYFKFFGDGKYGPFWAKKLIDIWYLLITEKFLFWSFLEWEIRFFWDKTLMERWYLLITEKFLFWTFWVRKIRSFFETKSWWKDDIYWLLKSSCFGLPKSFCFELFGDGK